MEPLTKFDVILYLIEPLRIEDLFRQIEGNVFFEKTPERKIKRILTELKKENLVQKKEGIISLTDKAANLLAFLLWCKKDSIDYNKPLKKRHEKVFRKIFENRGGTEFSRQTTAKIIKDMEKANFLTVIKKKPILAKSNLTDRTIFFANIFRYDFGHFESIANIRKIDKDSPKLKEHLIKLHVYSTTVTEGNAASEKDVERVINNLPTRLSPRETLEIMNAKNAIEEVYKTHKTGDISIPLIKRLHKILMASLVENPGEFSYVKKRVIGSSTRFPGSKIEIDTAMEAMINFYGKYRNKMHPLILAPLVHFLFVSIHPFIDGNGRVARLLHSFILLKADLPVFAFDPNHRNTYFDLLEKGRSQSAEGFVNFCIEKYAELVEKF